jgi:lysophospholipase L1-like esterase
MSLNMMAFGDSKTAGLPCCLYKNGYRDELQAYFTPLFNVVRFPTNASSGRPIAQALADLPAFIAAQTHAPDWILINQGTTDVVNLRDENITPEEWKDDMGAILDAFHSAFPLARILCMRPMWVGFEPEIDLIDDTLLPEVLSTRGPWAAVGPDEREFLPGHAPDGTHPDSGGYTLTAEEWRETMGYN